MLILCALCVELGFGDTLTGVVTLSNGRPARNAVVYLSGHHVHSPGRAVVDQRNKAFIPHVSAVPIGTTVVFPNNDTVFHNVFAEYDAKRFDLGMYPRGASRSVRFDKPGVVALFCSVHSEMGAFILVVDSDVYTVTDSSGAFRLDGVPKGTHSLKVWHETGEVGSVSVVGRGPVRIQARRP
ncbi:MAG: methylamine utilization protein [Fimbriimonas ginsengisoli]|uniref:Methylamine utilization protein n=1 Tax=Fimbriimonas ginsengisoli TaxID=1005039 RepID=A0A931PVF2_FIMGI|nr:methylamine utilization protein [Fimbriimonas ginsengisoli]